MLGVLPGWPRGYADGLMQGDHEEHRPYEDFAVRHVMGGLDDAEQGTFRSHLLDCTECRARVGELRSIASDLAEVERADRRERAAQRVETKEREAEPPHHHRPEPPSRGTRVLAVSGVLLLVMLSIWNFVLRGQNEELRGLAAAEVAAGETINFGDAWTQEVLRPGHEGIARVLDGRMAVMVRGTDDDATYRIDLVDDAGSVVESAAEASVGGQVRWFGGPLAADVSRVEVVLGRSGGAQTIVYRAVEAP